MQVKLNNLTPKIQLKITYSNRKQSKQQTYM